jgi:hypothetical protein
MPVPDLIVGKLRCAKLPAGLEPLVADLPRPPTLATGSPPDIDAFSPSTALTLPSVQMPGRS